MDRPQIALVCRDDALRLPAARAFDHAPVQWEVTLHREAPPCADVVVAVGDDIAGDVRFDPARPHLAVDEVGSVLSHRACRVVVVIGASGGCGATSVALHLAAEGSHATCLVDLHERARAALRLGVDPVDLEQAPGPVPVAGGFRIFSTGATDAEAALDRCRRDFERVILDAPAQAGARLAPGCDAVVLVMLPTVTSANHAVQLLDAFDDVPVAVVANRVGPGGETTRAELQRILGRRITLELPCSRGLRDAEDDARLLTSAWSPWRRRVARLRAALEETA